MRFIKEYSQFITEEWSKNEPISEIIGVDRGLAVFVIGAPGIGKSYFVTNHIHSKNPNIKDFSTDDVSLMLTKDPNIYYKGREKEDGGLTKNASQLNLAKMEKFMETGQNFIYDTTGSGKEFTDRGFEHIKEIYDKIVKVKDASGCVVNEKLLEDVLESLIGALFLDLGYQHAEAFILKLIKMYVDIDKISGYEIGRAHV
jgi:dsRNA-specific ribonuclease